MTTNNSKFYFDYLNKSVYQWKNSYHRSIGKKPINADYSDLTEETELNSEAPKFKVDDIVRITSPRIFLVKLHWKLVKRSIYYQFCVEN